jgi:DNA invertase Pin-like site-specific DNA recombinase
MEKAFGYLRVSTAGQAKDGYSLEEQRVRIIEYCQDQHLELVKTYEDAGISGAKVDEDGLIVDRPGIQALLGDLKDSGVKFVVVLTTSRLWRSDFAKVLIQRESKRDGVDVRAIACSTYSIFKNDQDPSAFLVNGMMELLDQYERLEIALKLRRGRIRKATKGGYAGGGTAVGYKTKRGMKMLKPDAFKADTVRRVLQLRCANPTWSLERIAVQLNLDGHTTARGSKFHRIQVKRILDRKALYSGTYSYAGIEAAGQHQAIVQDGPEILNAGIM